MPSTIVGVEEAGTAYRMDNVPIRCRKVTDAPAGILSDAEILERILVRVKELKAEKKAGGSLNHGHHKDKCS